MYHFSFFLCNVFLSLTPFFAISLCARGAHAAHIVFSIWFVFVRFFCCLRFVRFLIGSMCSVSVEFAAPTHARLNNRQMSALHTHTRCKAKMKDRREGKRQQKLLITAQSAIVWTETWARTRSKLYYAFTHFDLWIYCALFVSENIRLRL